MSAPVKGIIFHKKTKLIVIIMKLILFSGCHGPWLPPDGWTVGDPVVYFYFEDMTGITVYSGDEAIDEIPLVPGMVNLCYI